MISAGADVQKYCFFSFQPALFTIALKACSLAHMAHSANTEVASPTIIPVKILIGPMLMTRRCGYHMIETQDKPSR